MDSAAWSEWWKRRGAEGIRRILMEHWDPIGVAPFPTASDEYNAYVGPVGRMLRARAPSAEIQTYLQHVSSDLMGLASTDRAAEHDREVVGRLKEWYEGEDPAEPPRV
jgi:hypothetical protein